MRKFSCLFTSVIETSSGTILIDGDNVSVRWDSNPNDCPEIFMGKLPEDLDNGVCIAISPDGNKFIFDGQGEMAEYKCSHGTYGIAMSCIEEPI